jgi:tungstate transport system substrate-binding protein
MTERTRRREPRRRARQHTPAVATALLLTLLACTGPEGLVLATTSSADDSGLLQALSLAWQAEPGTPRLHVLVVGSGEALALGRRGDADVLLVHSPEAEARFMEAGGGLLRREVMRNRLVIVGPASDPAEVGAAADVIDAMARVARAGAPFVSRGDASGTHERELELWAAASLSPQGERAAWYIDAGQGMGETLRTADELGAYTLTDMATYSVWRGRLRLVVLQRGDPGLDNRYSVIVPTASRARAEATEFADWLASGGGQAVIADFGRDRFGAPLFEPLAVRPAGEGNGPR